MLVPDRSAADTGRLARETRDTDLLSRIRGSRSLFALDPWIPLAAYFMHFPYFASPHMVVPIYFLLSVLQHIVSHINIGRNVVPKLGENGLSSDKLSNLFSREKFELLKQLRSTTRSVVSESLRRRAARRGARAIYSFMARLWLG